MTNVQTLLDSMRQFGEQSQTMLKQMGEMHEQSQMLVTKIEIMQQQVATMHQELQTARQEVLTAKADIAECLRRVEALTEQQPWAGTSQPASISVHGQQPASTSGHGQQPSDGSSQPASSPPGLQPASSLPGSMPASSSSGLQPTLTLALLPSQTSPTQSSDSEDDSIDLDDPYWRNWLAPTSIFSKRGGDLYCNLCGKFDGPGHRSKPKHRRYAELWRKYHPKLWAICLIVGSTFCLHLLKTDLVEFVFSEIWIVSSQRDVLFPVKALVGLSHITVTFCFWIRAKWHHNES